RVGIARALSVNPELLIADEPVSSLDVSVQAQILKLLSDLNETTKISIIFITHDLRVVKSLADTVAVMNRGEIVEYGVVEEVYANPRSEYTKTLLGAVKG
nr:ABC transporter ATP-binding protein [Candidatus Goldiibacteriota bacterium]